MNNCIIPTAKDIYQPPHGGAARCCDGCTACCVLYELPYLNKPPHTPCPHQTATGCAIYNQGRHNVCTDFLCMWMRTKMLPSELRPDRCGAIIVCHGNLVVTKCGCRRYSVEAWDETDRPKFWQVDCLTRAAMDNPSPAMSRFEYWQAKKGIVLKSWTGDKETTGLADGSRLVGRFKYLTNTAVPFEAVAKWTMDLAAEYWGSLEAGSSGSMS